MPFSESLSQLRSWKSLAWSSHLCAGYSNTPKCAIYAVVPYTRWWIQRSLTTEPALAVVRLVDKLTAARLARLSSAR